MADKKEKDLSAITTFSGSHIIRVLTDAGVSVKATFANVAKWIIESYASSSLAGSNQSVKSAIDSLNSNRAYALNIGGNTERTFEIHCSNRYQAILVVCNSNNALFMCNPNNGSPMINNFGTATITAVGVDAQTFRLTMPSSYMQLMAFSWIPFSATVIG